MTGYETAVDKREALLDAAKALFAEVGYARVTHADVAYEAGIARTTFYEHFASKEDLLIHLVQRDLPALITKILDSVPVDLAPAERLGELTERMVEFVGTDQLGLILHTEVPRLSLDAQAAIAAAHGDLTGEFMAIYRSGLDDGSFRAMPPRLAGLLIESTIMTGGRTVMNADEPKENVHEVAEETATFLVAALRT